MNPVVDRKIADFFEQYPLRKYKKGQILVHAGDDPDSIMHLVSGKVKKYDLSYRGDEVILNIFKPPAFFPMSYAINRTENEYFYEADADIELQKAPHDAVVKFLTDNPDVMYDLLSRVYRGSDGMLRKMSHLMAGTARSRLLYELIIECRRFGEEREGGYDVNLNESDLGSRAGLSRETVNRELSKLKADELISVVSKQIRVPSLARLEAAHGKEI